ncbi:MAG: ABC-2 family transporter protein [Methanocella sp. PtaU1.Bin125]|nr:MAG: ABC-2 family transporter protein [Methanocella sp. PtaU1.Bin125]
MTLAVLLQTMKDKARGNVLAILLILVFITYMVIMFPEVQKMTGIDEIMKSPAFQALLGKAPDFTSFDGFLSIEAFALIGLVICGYIGFLTASFLAGEIEMKTIDLLLAQPVTRFRLVVDRYGALVPMVALLVLSLLAGVFIGTKIMNIEVSYLWLALALALMGLFMLAFGAISLFVSAVLSDGRTAAIVSLGLLIVMYFMETIGQSVEKLGLIRSLSLFHYAQYSDILVYHDLSPGNAGVLATVTIAFLALAVFIFRRRDIHVT